MAAFGVAGLLALAAGCTGSSPGSADANGPVKVEQAGQDKATAPSTTPAAPPATIAVLPRNGTKNFSPTATVVVQASGGTLAAVTLVNGQGKKVKGTLSADRTKWTTAEQLGYDKTYKLNAAAKNATGAQSKAASTFSTVTPRTFTLPAVFPSPGMKVGVGQPISIQFDEPITNKVAAEKALKVTTSPAVSGSWHWFSDQVVDWRPQKFWKPGTRVKVEAKVYGVHVGDDIYGQQDVVSNFTIGTSKIATIDDRTHVMTVKISGKTVRHIPVSMGRGGSVTVNGKTIYFTTQSGTMIAAEKYPVKKMSSESYGLPKDSPLGYEEDIPLAVRVTADGVFVHAASWSVGDQGVRNVSHGCVNISPANARWFYDNFTYGDVVTVKNTGSELPFAPGYDIWSVSWPKWVAGSALR